MNRYKVFIAQNIPSQAEEYISKYCDYEKWEGEDRIPREVLLEKIKDKEGVMLTGVKIDKEFLDAAPMLKVVSNISVGYNNFDIKAMEARNIIGTNTPKVLDDTVADLIFGLILCSARRLAELDRYVKDGRWEKADEEKLFGVDVHHAVLGIIGMGRIGEAVAKRARLGFDMQVCYYNRNRKYDTEEKLGIQYTDMGMLLKRSDFVLLMTPLTEETFHLMDFEEFSLMKNSAIFINASRGQTVNEEALIQALKEKKILGAALDVYEKEPIDLNNPLLKMSNVVTVPHIGSATEDTRDDMVMLAAENMIKALSGELKPPTDRWEVVSTELHTKTKNMPKEGGIH